MITFDLKSAKDLLKYTIENNRYNLEKNINEKTVINLEGPAGVGKTSVAEQVAEELEMDLYVLRLSQIEELGDLVGYPIKKYNIQKGTEKICVDEKSLIPYYKQGWQPTSDEPVMGYAPPEWVQKMGKSGILVIDDFTRADVRFLQATMELVNKGKYYSWSLPQDWHIILTSNPDNGEYLVNSQDEAQKTRYFTANIEYNEKVWAEWAESASIDSRCINFMLMNPEVIKGAGDSKGTSNARQWVKFFHSISSVKDYKSMDGLRKIEMLGQMSVGDSLISSFISFIHNNMDFLIDPKDIILGRDEDVIFNKLQECIGLGANYRNDIASVIALRTSNWLINYADKNKVSDDVIDRIFNLITSRIFGVDLSQMISQKIYHKNRTKFVKLISKPGFNTYLLNKA